jgi:serine/threonine-protein kinase
MDGFPLVAAAVLRVEAQLRGAPISDEEAVAHAARLAEAIDRRRPAKVAPVGLQDTIGVEQYSQSRAPLAGHVIKGYRLETMVGEGGMGVVYRALRLATNEVVALKLPHPSVVEDPSLLVRIARRMEHEALATQRVPHPAFVKLVESFRWHSAPVLVLEWIAGETLASCLARGRLDPGTALRFGARVADAMAAAHVSSVMHNDLKPANIMLAEGASVDPDSVRILDLGVAILDELDAEAARTGEGNLAGTPLYMAPEQLQSLRLDPRADVYAIGAIVYECMTGRPPFGDSTSVPELMMRKLSGAPPPPSAMVGSLPRQIDAILLRALSPAREGRYPSAAALRDDLRVASAHVVSTL